MNIGKQRFSVIMKLREEKTFHAEEKRMNHPDAIWRLSILSLSHDTDAALIRKTEKHLTPILKSPLWLPVRIDLKILLLVYKALNGFGSTCLSDFMVAAFTLNVRTRASFIIITTELFNLAFH